MVGSPLPFSSPPAQREQAATYAKKSDGLAGCGGQLYLCPYLAVKLGWQTSHTILLL